MHKFTLLLTVYHLSGGSTGQTQVCIHADTVAEARRLAVNATIRVGLWVKSIETIEVLNGV